jgi:hypothetical protein
MPGQRELQQTVGKWEEMNLARGVGTENSAGDRKILICLFSVYQNIICISFFKISNPDRHFLQRYITPSLIERRP